MRPRRRVALLTCLCVLQAARRMADAEKSGASVVLDLLRASIDSKSIRVVEVFKKIDTNKDGLISRQGRIYTDVRVYLVVQA